MLQKELIRSAMGAGSFYPEDKSNLHHLVTDLLRQAQPNGKFMNPRIVLVPHAGYVFSGQVAAQAYASLDSDRFERVFVIGNSHNFNLNKVALYSGSHWQTPLGKVAIDQDIVQKLAESTRFFEKNDQAHAQEHSLEVQLPFLQTQLQNFKIIPLLMGRQGQNKITNVAKMIEKYVDDRSLIIISTDLSHYPSYQDASDVDKITIEVILSGNIQMFRKHYTKIENLPIDNLSTVACAKESVILGLKLAKNLELEQSKLLVYANSGDVTGDKNRVVGYASIGFFEKQIQKVSLKESSLEKKVLGLARKTLQLYFRYNQLPQTKDPALQDHQGIFVTLKKDDQLRGCIGLIQSDRPLAETIPEMTVSAAVEDPRFPQVKEEEIDQLQIEISLLSQPRLISDYRNIKIGQHGVILEVGNRKGVFLPQVATEFNYDLTTFLHQLCVNKLGLKGNCFLNPKAKMKVFTVKKYQEKLGGHDDNQD